MIFLFEMIFKILNDFLWSRIGKAEMIVYSAGAVNKEIIYGMYFVAGKYKKFFS